MLNWTQLDHCQESHKRLTIDDLADMQASVEVTSWEGRPAIDRRYSLQQRSGCHLVLNKIIHPADSYEACRHVKDGVDEFRLINQRSQHFYQAGVTQVCEFVINALHGGLPATKAMFYVNPILTPGLTYF